MIATFTIPDPVSIGSGVVDSAFGAAGHAVQDTVANAATDIWTGIMLSFWQAGLWLMRLVFGLMDTFLTPDLSASGPAAPAYATTFWLGGALVTILALVQIGITAARRDGRSAARLLIGGAQFAVVWAGWLTYAGAVLAACSGLTHALMTSMLGIDAWETFDPFGDFDFVSANLQAGLATVLGLLGLFLILGAIGHLVIMLARGAALLILAATAPVSAAGLVSDVGRPWFWKSFRWFHAAAFTPVLTVLVMGIGTKVAEGTIGSAAGGDANAGAIATALISVSVIVVSLAAPMALFRLLAFVDPGTASGASMRAGVAAAGGLGSLLGGGSNTSSTASQQSSDGQSSQGEQQSAAVSQSRVTSALQTFAGAPGALLAGAATMTAAGIDSLNQAGVGDASYFPDYYGGRDRQGQGVPDGARPESSGDEQPTPSAPLNLGMPTTGGSAAAPSAPAAAGSAGGGSSAAAAAAV